MPSNPLPAPTPTRIEGPLERLHARVEALEHRQALPPDLYPAQAPAPALAPELALVPELAELRRDLAAVRAQLQATEKWCAELAARVQALELARDGQPSEIEGGRT